MRQSFVHVFEARHFRSATNIYRYRTLEILSCLYIRPTTLVHCYFPFSIDFCSPLHEHMAWHDMALVPLPAAGNNRCHLALPCSELEEGQRSRGGGLSTEQPLFGH